MRTRKPQIMWAVQCQWGRMTAPWIIENSVRSRRKDVVKLFWSWWEDNPKTLRLVKRNLRDGSYRFVKVTVQPIDQRWGA